MSANSILYRKSTKSFIHLHFTCNLNIKINLYFFYNCETQKSKLCVELFVELLILWGKYLYLKIHLYILMQDKEGYKLIWFKDYFIVRRNTTKHESIKYFNLENLPFKNILLDVLHYSANAQWDMRF